MNSTLIMDFTNYLQCLRLKTNTINSYLSSLRAIFNAALRSQLVKVKDHPFGELKLKREVTAKRAVSVDIIKQIAAVDLKKTGSWNWLPIFLCSVLWPTECLLWILSI